MLWNDDDYLLLTLSRYYALLHLHNSDDDHSCVRSAASWDENQQVYGGRNKVTGGYSLCFF